MAAGVGRGGPERRLRRRIFCAFIVAVCGMVGIVGRLAFLQIGKHEELAGRARRQQHRLVTLYPQRGKILDAGGRALAYDSREFELFADPTLARDVDFFAPRIATIIGMPRQDVEELMTRTRDLGWLRRDVPQEMARRVNEARVAGVRALQDGKRWRVSVNGEDFRYGPGMTARLARALEWERDDLIAAVGDLDMRPTEAAGDGAGAAEAPVVLPRTVPARVAGAVENLFFSGVTCTETAEPNWSVEVDVSVYRAPTDQSAYQRAAQRLAPLLEMGVAQLEDKLTEELQYVVIKEALTQRERAALTLMERTFWVARPGAISENYGDREPQAAMVDATKILRNMLSKERKAGTKYSQPVLSAEEIARAIGRGATAGPLAVWPDRGEPYEKLEWGTASLSRYGLHYGVPGVSVGAKMRRRYPYGDMASPTLGYVNYAERPPHGLFGLERSLDWDIAGTCGEMECDVTSSGEPIPGTMRKVAPTDGRDVVLTLDAKVQQIADEEVKAATVGANAKRGKCIVMNPQNGEILAMSSWPRWDANDPGTYSGMQPAADHKLENTLVHHAYEPGSTMKLVAVAAALDDNMVRDGQTILYCTGVHPGGGRPVSEAEGHRHGVVTPKVVLQKSCNIAACALAMKMGDERFVGWCRKFGFGERTRLGLPGEVSGNLNAREAVRRSTLARMGFGQALTVTVPQLAAAYAAIANKGEWVQPHIVKGKLDAEGHVVEGPAPERRQVCSARTATLVNSYLEACVADGTGTSSQVPGYRVCGKTGTAQMAVDGVYKAHIGSFVAYLPADEPRVLVLMTVEMPRNGYYGGVVAAPFVQNVLKRSVPHLGIMPEMRSPSP